MHEEAEEFEEFVFLCLLAVESFFLRLWSSRKCLIYGTGSDESVLHDKEPGSYI